MNRPHHPSSARLFARRPAGRGGFTLIEILIVVIILGILAAIVIPQFTSAAEDARTNSTKTLLQTIRSQVQLYKVEHYGKYPTADGTPAAAWDWAKMTGKTDDDGNAGTANGPYLQSTPVNPLNGQSAVGTAAAASLGFFLDADEKFKATDKDFAEFAE